MADGPGYCGVWRKGTEVRDEILQEDEKRTFQKDEREWHAGNTI